MATKTSAARPAEPEMTCPDDLRAAYQAHTLAQMLYTRLASAPSWTPIVPAPLTTELH